MYLRPPVFTHNDESISYFRTQATSCLLSPLSASSCLCDAWQGICWGRRHSGHRSQSPSLRDLTFILAFPALTSCVCHFLNPKIYCLLLLVMQNRFLNVLNCDKEAKQYLNPLLIRCLMGIYVMYLRHFCLPMKQHTRFPPNNHDIL